jgi:ABC-type glutathione transport system ATPase component
MAARVPASADALVRERRSGRTHGSMHGATRTREISTVADRATELHRPPNEIDGDAMPLSAPRRAAYEGTSRSLPDGAVPRLRLDGLTHRFRTPGSPDTLAISNVSLDVEAGRFVSLIGQSGCGRSTLFNILAGVLRSSEGGIVLDGADIAGRAGLVSYMLQKDLMLP